MDKIKSKGVCTEFILRIKSRNCFLSVNIFLVFMICIFAPFELYIGNLDSRTEMWFNFKDFWFIPILFGSACFLGLEVLGLAVGDSVLPLMEGSVAGIGFALYLQGNFLGIKGGQMLGDSFDWTQYTGRIVGNTVLILSIIVCTCIIRCRWPQQGEKGIKYVALLLTAMQMVTLAVLLPKPLVNQLRYKETGYITDKDIMSMSKEENVVVFLLDMFDTRFFLQAIEESQELLNELDGFTFYENSSGGYMTTEFSIPFLMTGKYCYNPLPTVNFVNQSCEKERAYWDDLLDAGWEISTYTDNDKVPERLKQQTRNYLEDTAYISDKLEFSVDLYKFVMCKYFPDFVKPFVWMNGTEFIKWKSSRLGQYEFWNYDNAVVDKYTEIPIDTSLKAPQYKFIHIQGAHMPFKTDEFGKVSEKETDYVTCGKGALRIVERYMEKMKEAGVYDSASIIIMADHGEIRPTHPSSPLFLVKRAQETGKMKFNTSPVSQKEYGSTILELAGINSKKDWGPSIYDFGEGEKRERVYYNTRVVRLDADGDEVNNLVEYIIDDVMDGETFFHKTGVEYDIDGRKLMVEDSGE